MSKGRRDGHIALSSPQHDGERPGVVSLSEENGGERREPGKARPIRWLGEQTDRPGTHKAAAGDRSPERTCLRPQPRPGLAARRSGPTDVQAFVIAVQVTKSLWAKWFRLSWRWVEAACRCSRSRALAVWLSSTSTVPSSRKQPWRERDETRADRPHRKTSHAEL